MQTPLWSLNADPSPSKRPKNCGGRARTSGERATWSLKVTSNAGSSQTPDVGMVHPENVASRFRLTTLFLEGYPLGGISRLKSPSNIVCVRNAGCARMSSRKASRYSPSAVPRAFRSGSPPSFVRAVTAIRDTHANDRKVRSFECGSSANESSFGQTIRTCRVDISPSESTPQNDFSRATLLVPRPAGQFARDRVYSLRHRFGKCLREADYISIMAGNELARFLELGCPYAQLICLCIPVQDFHHVCDSQFRLPRRLLLCGGRRQLETEFSPSSYRSTIVAKAY